MKPIAIFRHVAIEGPGYFADFLDELAIPWELIRIDAGEAVPDDASMFSGLVFMGGTMSVKDNLPWMELELALIRDAVVRDIPVLGHCLGGQLMSKALGGEVRDSREVEIGWRRVLVFDNEVAYNWFGDTRAFEPFHWHSETFTPPEGATNLISSLNCVNQAFAIGKHLALQCHVEMTEQMIRDWCEAGSAEIAANHISPDVQTAAVMQAEMVEKLLRLREVAKPLYQHWLKGIVTS